MTSNRIVRNALAAVGRIMIPASESASVSTASHELSRHELLSAVRQHKQDVARGMAAVADMIKAAGENHDHTKINRFRDYYRYFSHAQKTGIKSWDWCREIHAKQERHHIEDWFSNDVNLIDVLEHIVDGVMAGIGRSGEYSPDPPPVGLLEKAYANTQKLIASMVERKN